MTTPDMLARQAQARLFRKEPAGHYEVTVTGAERLAADGSSAGTKSKARVQIYGAIGDWWEGTDAATLARTITDLDTDEIEVHLNSPGGIAFDGIAIYNALRQHDADVHVMVDGLAASAASLIAMAGDKVTMGVGSQLMIHNASGVCFGQAADMRQVADVLDKISLSGADIYTAKAGGTREDWKTAMDAETWYTADEAVQAGLADAVDKASSEEQAKDATAAFDLSIFMHAGRQDAPEPHKPPARPAEPTTTQEGGVAMSDNLSKGLRERLGIPAESKLEEADLLAALDEALNEQAEPKQTTKLPAGVVAIDESQLASLQADAAQGRAARQTQLATEREAKLTAAVNDGRIHKDSVGQYRTLLERDDQDGSTMGADLLASLAKNTVPVTAIGFTGGIDEVTDDDAVYAKAWGPTEKKEA